MQNKQKTIPLIIKLGLMYLDITLDVLDCPIPESYWQVSRHLIWSLCLQSETKLCLRECFYFSVVILNVYH